MAGHAQRFGLSQRRAVSPKVQLSKLENIEDNLNNPPKPVVVHSDFLNHQSHGWKFMALGPDNKLATRESLPSRRFGVKFGVASGSKVQRV